MVAEDIFSVTDGNASFLRAARAGNLEKVLEYLKGSIDINTSNANGLNALHLASKEGHVTVLNELLKRGANVNAATKKGNTSLHIASLAGQEEIVKILVRNGANVNVQSQNGFTPLYMAAQENHDKVVRYLLANGANQSLATEDGFTPLAVALQQGHDKVVAVLLENDTKGRVRLPALHIAAKKDDCKAAALLLQNDHDPDVTSKSGFTPLHIAAHYGNENIAHLLLEKSADVNFAAKHQITPLHVASKWGKTNMVTLLIENNGKIDASTRDGLTPLHCAARSGHDQVVDLLLEKGAPITAKTKNGLAPLHMAAQGDHVDSARILLYHKAPVDDVTVDYLTALHVAAHCGHVRVAKLLLDRKADPNARALNGFTPLHIACKKNRIKVVELLLKHGASIEATTESGLTPLHVASFMGCMNIVIFLIQHGANPDVPTVRGETPLHLAARANQADIIRILLRNGAHVDACAREQQTPLHIAARLGNVDIVGLLLQHGAAVDATTKDMYTALHIAAKEGQEEVASVLLDHGASLTATNKKGFTPLHLAAKYGNIKVARLLLQKDAPVDAQGKNGVTPLHVAAHYDHVNVALLLLDKGASPHATAKNGYTPLHIAAKKNQMDIATTLLEYGAKPNAESKAGFTPLHLAAQEGHTDMTTLLIEHHADVNSSAKNGLTPLHLCAQEDRVNVAAILVKNGAEIGPQTKAGYTPLHVACHFGQINMVRFLLQHGADVNAITSHGYTPLHQAAQQGHTLIINLLLENNASPNHTTNQGQTALSIAQRLGYISVVETLKVVTETIVTTTTTTVTEEKYKVVAPEIMQETFMSDSEDEGGDDFEDSALFGKPTHATHVYLPYYEGQKMQMSDDANLGDQTFHYLTVDEIQSLGDDSLPIDVTRDEKGIDSMIIGKDSKAPLIVEEDQISPAHVAHLETVFAGSYVPDNVDIAKAPVHAGFLVSFMVDARGGAMRGCRHSGVRVIIPPRKAPMPMRITCRYLRREKLAHPPPLMEGEACASRILEVGPASAKFLGPVIIEIPHFASLRGREREITILRSDNGETWREHTLEATEDAVHDVLNESFEGEELSALEDLNTNRITRILTTDFPQYFAIITRIRQEVHAIGPEGGMVSSTVVPQVQAIFPEGALTKKIKVGLQAQPIPPELVAKLLGNRVAVSPIVTVEPRRRKFHKPITLTIPVPQAATKGMINQYSGDAPTLRLLCSITGGTTKAQWEDVTGSTPLTFVNDCVSFTTTVSARFWLMDCRQVNEATRFATELYKEAIHVPFMAKFVVFAKRYDPMEAHLRVFCMTDDKEDKTLESQEHFVEVAKSRDVEVLEGKCQYLEFAGNLIPVTKSGEQLFLAFQAFRENRLPFLIRVKDTHQEPMGRLAFMREPRVGRGEPPQSPICNLNIALPDVCKVDSTMVNELVTVEKKYGFIEESGLSKPELIHRADLRLSDIAKQLKDDWVPLALQLDIPESDINTIKSEHSDVNQQAIVMLRLWMQKAGNKANGNTLEKALRKINREDIISNCMFNVELVTDDVEKAVAKVHLDQSGFDAFKEELGPSRDASLRRETSLEISYDEQDLMKEAESAAETSSESGSVCEKDLHTKGQVLSIKETKTPPPSPAEKNAKGEQETSVHEKKEVLEDGTIKHVVTTVTKTTIVQDGEELQLDRDQIAKLVESETWPSGEMDTSQVSVSSLPEDEKSEPTTATMSSGTTAEQDISSADGDKPQIETRVEEKEWTETDDSGGVMHVICKKTTITKEPEEIIITKGKVDAEAVSLPGETSVQHPGEEDMELTVDENNISEKPSDEKEESLSFAEKRNFFQRLSMTNDVPVSTSTVIKTSKETVQTDFQKTGEVIEEQISFSEKLKMFQAEKEDVKKQSPEKVKDENEQKLFELDKEELTESEIAAVEYLESKNIMTEQEAEESSDKKDISIKETTSLEAVEQEVASMLAEVDRQSKELLGHVVGLLPEGDQHATKLDISETEKETDGKYVPLDLHYAVEKDISSTEFQFEVSGRDLDESLVSECKPKQLESIETESHLKANETAISHPPPPDAFATTTPFWPPQSPSKVRDESFMPEQQTAAGKTTTEDSVLPSPSKDSPLRAKTVGLDESSHSVLLPSFGMDDEKSSTNETEAKTSSEQIHDSEFISKSSSESVFKDSAQKDELRIDDSKLADEDEDDDDINLFKDKDEYEMTVNLSVKVQQQIKSQILNEELDQSIEENPPEEKVLGVSNIPDFDHEEKVAQQIRTTILSQELEADIESASPEQKEFPVHSTAAESGFNIESLKTSDYLLQNALQQETEQITWETPIQEETESVLHEEVKEIPREKQLIVEHDEEVISEGDDVMKDTQNSDSICPTSESSISEKDKFKPSSLEQVSSEISDEDLVERDHSSSEQETKPINILKEEMDLIKKELLEEKTKKELTTEDLCRSSETQVQDETPTDKKSDILESDNQMKTEHESHTDSYTSESSDYTHRETEVNSSGAVSEDSHYKDRQDSSEISDRESSQPLFVTAETLYTVDGREDKRSDSEPSDGIKDSNNIVLRQKSASKKEKQGGQEMESWSSSGETESHYYSFETSESGKTPRDTPAISRPCSSEFEVTIVSGQPSSEYETCVTSQETSIGVSESYTTAVTSQETSYSTACSSLSHSSRESAYSVDSESSGHLASLELSSETSETLVPSAQEIEMDLVQEIDTPVLEEDIAAQAGFKEPYDSEIPECIIREGVEVPFLKDWSLQANESDISSAKEWIWPCERDIQMVMSPFEIITDDDLAECLQDQAAQEPLSDSDKALYDGQSKETIQIDSLETKSEKSMEEEKFISEMQNDKAESEKYLLCFESSELPSQSIDAIDKLEVGAALSDDVAEQLSHDELSISESSATQSEQTWQTSGIETAIHISQQMSSCFKPYTETPPVTRVDSTVSDVTIDLSGSPIHSSIVQDNLQSAQEPSIYHQLNGPVEVEYIPEYDAPFDDSRENISVQNVQETQIQNYDAEGQHMQISDDQTDFNSDRCSFLDSEEMVALSQPPVEFTEQWISDGEVQAQAREDSLSLLTEDLWQQHVHRHESEIERTQDIQHDDVGETNCLPESEQNVLHSQGFVNINSEMVKDYEIEKPKLESRDSFDMTDKAEAIDTSPEDERYDNLLHDLDEQICDDDSIKDKIPESFQKLSTDSIHDQRQPADKSDLLVTKEALYESQNTYLYNMGFEKELPEEVLDVAEDQFTEEKDKLQDSYQETEFVDGVYERGQEYDDVSLGYGELYTHQEEDEETEDAERDERHYSPAAVSIDESKRSTPSYDTLGVRKFFGRSGEHDDMSVSSLQEFERLEAEIAMGSRMSQGSGDSNERHSITKSGEHDDVSVNSLIEFEKLETECIEVEHSESVPVVEKLSEIEEGHESLSEASQGTLSDHAAEHEESEDSDDYDKRMCEIDEIIRQAQSNVEKFDDSSAVLSSEKSPAKHAHTVSSDSTESSLVDKSPSPKKYQGSLKETERTQILLDTQLPISLEREQAEHELESPATLARHIIIGRTISGHSVESGESLPRSSTSTVTQYDTESLKDREIDVEEIDIGCEDKKISPSEEEKYFIQETDQDSFQTEWNLHDLAEHGPDQIKQTCDTEFHSIPNIDHLKQLQPVEFRLQDDITKETFDIQWQEEESHLSTENLTGEGESIKAETTGSGHSSSNGRDGEHDISGKGDCMVSSTDSIDPSSSTATHATYQFETDSVMSSSINSAQASGEEFTMISSTDTLEAETKVTHVNELAFEEIPEAPHAEQEILLGGDKTESMSVEQSVTIQIGTEEYESLPQEVKDKVNKMLAASEVDPEISEFPANDTSFCESGVVTIKKIVKTQITSEQQVEKTEFPTQKDITLDSTFQSEIKYQEKEGEEKQPIPSHSSISSEMFHDDLQTFNKNTSSMPEGTDSSLNYPCSPVTSAVPQTVSSDYDIDEPSTLHKDTDESTAVSHGIGPATGNVIETEDSNEDGLSDGNECTVKTRIVTKTTITTSDGQEISETSEQDGSDNTLRDSMQQILDNFMTEENQQHWEKKQEKE